MPGARVLRPFEPIPLGSALLYFDKVNPVGARIDGQTVVFLEWRDAIVPSVAFSSSVYPVREGAWIEYSPQDDLAHYPELGVQNTAAFITAAGMELSIALGARSAVGADDLGLWTAEEREDSPQEPYFGGELPEGWAIPAELIRYNTGGSVSRVAIDRPVEEVRPIEGGVRITFRPTPPVATPTSHGGMTFAYPLESIDVQLPAREHVTIQVADHARTTITDNLYDLSYYTELSDREARERLIEPIPIPEALNAEWPLVELAADDITAVAERAVSEFGHLDAYWRAGDCVRPISGALSNSTSQLEGQWPTVALVVEFDHSEYPQFRFRRVLRLFAQGGRPALHDYAGIYFMEDLDNKRITPPAEPSDAPIDF